MTKIENRAAEEVRRVPIPTHLLWFQWSVEKVRYLYFESCVVYALLIRTKHMVRGDRQRGEMGEKVHLRLRVSTAIRGSTTGELDR